VLPARRVSCARHADVCSPRQAALRGHQDDPARLLSTQPAGRYRRTRPRAPNQPSPKVLRRPPHNQGRAADLARGRRVVGRGAARAAARQAASEARSPAPGCPRHLRWADLAGADWRPVGGAATGGRGQVHGPRPVPGLGRARLFPARLGAAPAAAGCLGKAPRGKQGSAARRQRPARIPRPGQVWGQVAPPDRRRGAALALGLAGAKRPAMKKLGDVLDAQLGAAPPAGPPPVTPVPRGGRGGPSVGQPLPPLAHPLGEARQPVPRLVPRAACLMVYRQLRQARSRSGWAASADFRRRLLPGRPTI
jgi:hypothetical protein